ncbi:MAG: hypothetical protein AAF849_15925, partial [Bacteroidota bacterium]
PGQQPVCCARCPVLFFVARKNFPWCFTDFYILSALQTSSARRAELCPPYRVRLLTYVSLILNSKRGTFGQREKIKIFNFDFFSLSKGVIEIFRRKISMTYMVSTVNVFFQNQFQRNVSIRRINYLS